MHATKNLVGPGHISVADRKAARFNDPSSQPPSALEETKIRLRGAIENERAAIARRQKVLDSLLEALAAAEGKDAKQTPSSGGNYSAARPTGFVPSFATPHPTTPGAAPTFSAPAKPNITAEGINRVRQRFGCSAVQAFELIAAGQASGDA